MNKYSFGSYLKKLRLAHNPSVTQEELAASIHRGKMTISLFEQGKNAPPQGELLEQIIVALSLNDDDASKLRLLSAAERFSLPNDIAEYFFSNPEIYHAILNGMKTGKTNSDWCEVSRMFGMEK